MSDIQNCQCLRSLIVAIHISVTKLVGYFLHLFLPNGPLIRYTKFRIAHAPGMPGTVSDPDMHHGTCVTHMPWCIPGPLTSGFLWSRWRGKRSRHSRRMRNPQFYVSGKRPMHTGFSQTFQRFVCQLILFETGSTIDAAMYVFLYSW